MHLLPHHHIINIIIINNIIINNIIINIIIINNIIIRDTLARFLVGGFSVILLLYRFAEQQHPLPSHRHKQSNCSCHCDWNCHRDTHNLKDDANIWTKNINLDTPMKTNMKLENRKYIFKWWMFHCHGFPEVPENNGQIIQPGKSNSFQTYWMKYAT